MSIIRTSGLALARWVLLLTGNLEVAACLRALPTIASLPLRLRVKGNVARIEYPTGASEWAEWQRQLEQDCPEPRPGN